eukprot:11065550-Lingulodinium_polyedra.AAC.1
MPLVRGGIRAAAHAEHPEWKAGRVGNEIRRRARREVHSLPVEARRAYLSCPPYGPRGRNAECG